MFCPHCGKAFAPGSNFCSACGAAVLPNAAPWTANRRIVRPRYPRAIAGVCSGFAQHFGWDLTLVRVLLCVFTVLTSGLGILCYIGAWIVLPEAPYALPYSAGYAAQQPPAGQTGQGTSA